MIDLGELSPIPSGNPQVPASTAFNGRGVPLRGVVLEVAKQAPAAVAMAAVVWLFLDHMSTVDVECHRLHGITVDQTHEVLTLTREALVNNAAAFGALDSCLERTVGVLERIERKLDQ